MFNILPALLAGLLIMVILATQDSIAIVSVDAAGQIVYGGSQAVAISPDGAFIAFNSTAENLVPGDANGQQDVFTKDLRSGAVRLISTDASGAGANGGSGTSSLSSDGAMLAFQSFATNLVPDDTATFSEIFVKDTRTGAITRVSTDAAGVPGNGKSEIPAITPDGNLVVFGSDAGNLVPGDTNGQTDVFLKNLATGGITRVSTDSGQAQADGPSGYRYGPMISADGRFVAFDSQAGNLAPGDVNGQDDVFVKDMETGKTILVSATADGSSGNGPSYRVGISGDARLVVFRSEASDLLPEDKDTASDIYLKDLRDGSLRLISTSSGGVKADAPSYDPSISADGRRVGFSTEAANLVPGDNNVNYDIFVKDIATGTTTIASVNREGVSGNHWSFAPAFPADGRLVVFQSLASDLVPGDTNGGYDIFMTRAAPGFRPVARFLWQAAL